ncbi:hypothetical protein BJV74DRAFT_487102 [Russula compacta]|nr:hypothetical protein BJV74DRAFT_487102 [Russula compacta]
MPRYLPRISEIDTCGEMAHGLYAHAHIVVKGSQKSVTGHCNHQIDTLVISRRNPKRASSIASLFYALATPLTIQVDLNKRWTHQPRQLRPCDGAINPIVLLRLAIDQVSVSLNQGPVDGPLLSYVRDISKSRMPRGRRFTKYLIISVPGLLALYAGTSLLLTSGAIRAGVSSSPSISVCLLSTGGPNVLNSHDR